MPPDKYIPRLVEKELDELISTFPAVSIEGVRSAGKTTTALRRAKTVFNLDDDSVLSIVEANPSQIVNAPEPILIDEWQQFPKSWDIVRRAVDDDYRPGRFVLTGSSRPANPPTHTGAGRFVKVVMRPMSLFERWSGSGERDHPSVSLAALLSQPASVNDKAEITGETEVAGDEYIDEIVAGGFPQLRRGSATTIERAMSEYCDRIVDTEFPAAGHRVRNPAALRRWLHAYAAATSTVASYEKIRDASTNNEEQKPPKDTTAPYFDTLQSMRLVDPLPAWTPSNNQIKRLILSSKHHLADPALAASFLKANAATLRTGKQFGPEKLRDARLAGRLFESLVALNLRIYAQAAEASVSHFRTWTGDREVDFIIEQRGDSGVVAIEVKFKQVVEEKDFRHLQWLKDKLGEELIDAVMVTTGPYAYRRPDDGIAVVPAALLGP